MIALILALAMVSAHAEPWVVYGQTIVNGYGIDNPTTNTAGAIGEVSALPYQVPEGKTLRIDGLAMESHSTAIEPRSVYVLIPWITDSPVTGTSAIRVKSALLSCTSSDHTTTCPTRFYIPSGKWVNLRIICQSPAMFTTLMGWHVFGEIEDAP